MLKDTTNLSLLDGHMIGGVASGDEDSRVPAEARDGTGGTESAAVTQSLPKSVLRKHQQEPMVR